MAITLWDLHAIKYGVSSIPEITAQGVNRNVTRVLGISSGDWERQFTSVAQVMQTGSFTTKAINTALGVVGMAGAKISSSAKLSLYRKAMDDGGTRKSGSVHELIEVEDGIVFPTNISCPDNDDATLNYAFYGTDPNGDGTSPLTFTGSSALSGTTNADQAYRLGPVTINGTTVNNVTNVEINFGIQVVINRGDGEIYPKGVAIGQYLPIITVTCMDNAVRGVIGEKGLDINVSKAIIKLRDVSKNSAVSYTTGISFTVTDGMYHMDNDAQTHAQPASFSFSIVPVKSGANDLIILATF